MKGNNRGNQYLFYVTGKDENRRLDLFLVDRLTGLSRSFIQKYLQDETVNIIQVNSLKKKPNYHLKLGDRIEVYLPPPKETHLEARYIELDIMFEDDDILILNKPAGIPVHPAPGHEKDTIVNALLFHFKEKGTLSNIGGVNRPGIIHRLDKDTAGVLLIAKNNFSHAYISREFAGRKIEKVYEAIVKGVIFPAEGVIDKPIGRHPKNRKKFTVIEDGREAITLYKTLDSKNETTLVRFIPKTGRTHQIRVHAANIGHPIIGDPLYARKSHPVKYIALFAKEITITHPRTEKPISFKAPYPKHFMELAEILGYDLRPSYHDLL